VKFYPALTCSLTLALSGASAQQLQQTPPASLGIVLDTSGSIGSKMTRARQLISELLKSAHSRDEFTFLQTSDRPTILSGFVNGPEAMQTLAFTQPKGRSALLDGIYLGLQLMKLARNERKFLLVISDGADNASRYTETEIWNASSQTGVRVYTAGLNDPTEVPELLVRIADRTRGRYVGVANALHLAEIARDLGDAMRAQE